MRLARVVLALAVGATLSACEATGPIYQQQASQGLPTDPPRPQAGTGMLSTGAGNPAVQPPQGGTGSLPVAPPAPRLVTVTIDHTLANNPAGLSEADVNRLKAGGPLGGLKWLYPYDGTVFPRDMLTPALMWQGDPNTQAVYLRISSQHFEYKTVIEPMRVSGGVSGIVATPLQPQLRVTQDIWDKAGLTTQGKSDPFKIELSTLVNGVVAGPVVSRFVIAPGAIKGSIYYTTYSSVPGAAGFGSLVRIPPRGKAELLIPGGATDATSCTGCHSVSADGSRLIMQSMNTSVTSATAPEFAQAYSYRLSQETGVGSRTPLNRYAAFAALYPDGSKYLTGSLVPSMPGGFGAGPLGTSYGNIALLDKSIPIEATLYDSDTAQVIPDTGVPAGALMPMFSSDGTRLTFNDFAIENGHGLAVMDYDTNLHKATNYKVVMQEDAASIAAAPAGKPGIRPGWPFFLPDNQAVVFVRTNSDDFTSSAQGASAAPLADFTMNRQSIASESKLFESDLYIADVDTGKVTLLARAMGFDDAGNWYLPAELDRHHNYSATVSPVAAGGYFWVFFDSVRNYGNLGITHQLWASAIELRPDGNYTTDPSYPAFYLEGQQFGTNNHRAFAARDKCKDAGACKTGVDCCTGFCSETCQPPPDSCSNTDERCAVSADCCNSANLCVNGFCALVELL